MTWEEKVQAAGAIGRISFIMRKPGDWYVHHAYVDRVEGSILSGGCVSEKTPQAAIEQHWEWLTDPKFHLRIYGDKNVKWNGFMWADYNA